MKTAAIADRENRVRERAHRIWEDEGRPEGRDADHWRRAEVEIEQEHALTHQPRGTPTLPDAAVPGNSPLAPENTHTQKNTPKKR
jgi:hypothetical protein